MITFHWNLIPFIVVAVILIAGIVKNRDNGGLDFTSFFLTVILIAFVLIWGGIFWW